MVLCVIPARGGSQRIPHKNIVDFNGRPLIAWSIETALASGIFTDVIVSTDDEEIAAAARKYGAQIPFMRPAQLADHYTGTHAVTQHALSAMQALGHRYRAVCCLYATAPLLTPSLLQQGWEKFCREEADYLYSCCEYPFPIQRAQYFDQEGTPHPFNPDCMPMRSQDLTPAYQDAGQFYFYSLRCLQPEQDTAPEGAKRPHKSRALILPRYRVVDIDTPEDLKLARAFARAVQDLKLD